MSEPGQKQGELQLVAEYITFRLGEEFFALEILEVLELREWEPVTRVPGEPPWLMGLLNLRGAIVPVVDLRLRLDLPVTPPHQRSVVILVALEIEGRSCQVGLLVDEVFDVSQTLPGDLRSTPGLGENLDGDLVKGVVTLQGQMVALLDTRQLMPEQNLDVAEGRSAAARESQEREA